MASLGERIIVLIDMDCFFCQVESRLQPQLQGKPVAVVQYNQWRSGGIIAVNYEARDFGVTRHMRGDEAKEKCPDINLVSVPSLRGKADTSKYRFAGREVVEVLKKHCSIIERASVDEAYLDITELVEKRIASTSYSRSDLIGCLSNTFVVGYCEDESNDEEQRRDGMERWIAEAYGDLGDVQARKLAVAGLIVEELRAEIYKISKFRCSAGISNNKILAKLACGLHKPNRQTILSASAVPSLYSSLPVKKVRNLGGKFGNIVMESLGCNVMADLMRYSLQDLQKRFDEKTGSWLFNIARGIDNEPVTTRLVCKSIGSSKNFPGKQAITKLEVLKHWVGELSADVSDRLEQDLEENERRATTLTVSFSYYVERKLVSQSRSCPLKSYKAEKIALQSIDLITRSTKKPVANIGIAATKFVQAKGSGNFVNFFKNNGSSLSNETNITEPLVNAEMMANSNGTCSKSNINAPVVSGCDNSMDPNFKTNHTEITTKMKSTEESIFIRPARSREENSVASDSIFPKTTLSGNSCKNSFTETSEKVKSKVESFFAKQIHSRDENLKARENCSLKTTILDHPCRSGDTETAEKVKFKVESFFAQQIQNGDENLKASEIFSPKTTILDHSCTNDDTETDKKVKSKAKSLFAQQIQNRDENHTIGERFSPKPTVLKSEDTEIAGKPKSKAKLFFSKEARRKEVETNSGEPISPSTAILGSTQCKKALNRENLKNSFFMNFLMDSKPDVVNESVSDLTSCTEEPSCSRNPDNSHVSLMKEDKVMKNEDLVQQEKKTTDESNLLAQLLEIFPDLDNIDRSVLQILPIELQRIANSYIKTKVTPKVQPTKNSTKSKTKTNKSQKVNSGSSSVQNFFVKTSPNASSESPLRKCEECNQSIQVEKYAEHKDFHVAQDLQRMINQSAAREEDHSPAISTTMNIPAESTSLKRRLAEETPKSNKKAKTISSFFCA